MQPQTLTYSLSAVAPSAYKTSLQRTKIKVANGQPFADFTKHAEKNTDNQDDPVNLGSQLLYGSYKNIPAGSVKPVTVRYDFTKPLLHATLLERDIEVSHWGGNLATEERYWLTNQAAKLKGQFSRVQWQMTQYANPPTIAGKDLHFPLPGGVNSPYFTDDIGNVSTSRFRHGSRQSDLVLKPRYPIFGGWHYKFRIGWDADLKKYVRKTEHDNHVLKVPFMSGPKTPDGISYEKITVKIVLPEGAE